LIVAPEALVVPELLAASIARRVVLVDIRVSTRVDLARSILRARLPVDSHQRVVLAVVPVSVDLLAPALVVPHVLALVAHAPEAPVAA